MAITRSPASTLQRPALSAARNARRHRPGRRALPRVVRLAELLPQRRRRQRGRLVHRHRCRRRLPDRRLRHLRRQAAPPARIPTHHRGRRRSRACNLGADARRLRPDRRGDAASRGAAHISRRLSGYATAFVRARIRSSRMVRGIAPSFSTSWKRFRSNLSPSAAFASSRSRVQVMWPIL